MRKLAILTVVAAFMGLTAGSAEAVTPTSIFDGHISCGEVTDEGSGGGIVTTSLGQVWCGTVRPADNINSTVTPAIAPVRSTVKTFDGVPLDVNVGFPNPATFGPPPYPVVMAFHGYGGFRYRFKDMQRWLDKGYAVYSPTQRGFDESCLTPGSKAADPTGCAKGYIHMLDQRYEVRDSQDFVGELVDQGLVIPNKIAAVGSSYGGGTALSMAALKDRRMLPDGTLAPWKSPDGTQMSIAVATPNVAPTEVPAILAPSGSNLDYIADSSYSFKTNEGVDSRPGILKEGWVQGLAITGFVSPIGTDPSADLSGWKAAFDVGEPYDGVPAINASIQELSKYHSPYGLDHSEPPAPILMSTGYSDDLVPVNESTRFYNRTRAQYPDLPISLFFGSLGHPRGQAQPAVTTALRATEDKWTDYYLGGTGTQPPSEVTSYTQTCPNGTAPGGPYTAPDWASISPGEVRLQDPAAQTISATSGDPAAANAFNGLVANQNPCVTQPGTKEAGSANWDLPPAPAGGYTVQGAPTVVADIDLGSNPNSQVAARLLDISPDGTTETLVARQLYRPWSHGTQVFQLFANAWKVEEGHVLRLQFLSKDAAGVAGAFLSNFGRPSNDQGEVTVKNMDLRIPVVETPGSLGGLVKAPSPKVLPDRQGVALARGYDSVGSQTIDASIAAGKKATVKGKLLTLSLSCPASYTNNCAAVAAQVKGAPKKGKGKGVLLARGSNLKVAGGTTKNVRLKLTGKARKLFRDSKKKRGNHRKPKKIKGLKQLRVQIKLDGKSASYAVVKRVGKVR